MTRGPLFQLLFSVLISSVISDHASGYFCPLNGSMPVCDKLFSESSLASAFDSLDSLINLDGLMDSQSNMTVLCNDLTGYRTLMNCSKPGLADCKDETLQRLGLVPDPDRWMVAMEYFCDHYQNMTCNVKALSGLSPSDCLNRVKSDAASPGQLLNMTDEAAVIKRFCKLAADQILCFEPLKVACGEPYSTVFSRLQQAAVPPPCDAPSTTPPSVSSSTSSDNSSAAKNFTTASSMMTMLICLSGIALIKRYTV